MKTTIALILTLLILPSCSWLFYDRFESYDDEFRGAKTTVARLNKSSLERRNEISEAFITFETVSEPAGEKRTVYFMVSRPVASYPPSSEGFISTGSGFYPVKLSDIISEKTISSGSTSSSYAKSDSTGTSAGSSTETYSRTWIIDKFKINLDKTLAANIKNSDKVLIRLYFGPSTGTFRIKGTDLKLVKKAI